MFYYFTIFAASLFSIHKLLAILTYEVIGEADDLITTYSHLLCRNINNLEEPIPYDPAEEYLRTPSLHARMQGRINNAPINGKNA